MNGNTQRELKRGLAYLLGECDADQEVRENTPGRWMRAMEHLLSGYDGDAGEVLSKQFDGGSDIVVLRDVEFYSLCEHHLLPFYGKVSLAYIPGNTGRIVGLSKLARLVDLYGRRLQVQERMTRQIGKALMEHLDAAAAGVVVRGRHLCMMSRGVEKQDSEMLTSCMLGLFRDNGDARAEVMRLFEMHR